MGNALDWLEDDLREQTKRIDALEKELEKILWELEKRIEQLENKLTKKESTGPTGKVGDPI